MYTYFKNAKIVDVIGETVIENGSVLVKDGIITEVGTDFAIPADAKVPRPYSDAASCPRNSSILFP